MTVPIVSKQQKDLKNWLKLREKRTAAVAAKPLKSRQEVQHANPRMKPSRFKVVLALTLADGHMWLISRGRSSGRMYPHSPRTLSKGEPDGRSSVRGDLKEQDRDQDRYNAAIGHRHDNRTPFGGALQMLKNGLTPSASGAGQLVRPTSSWGVAGCLSPRRPM